MTAASKGTEDEPRSGDSTAIAGLPDSYARWRRSSLGRITDNIEAELILDLLAPIAGVRILDVGCGDGALAAEMSRRGAEVSGLDPDPAMLALARDRALRDAISLHLVKGTAQALPFPDAAFDRVLAVTVLCFVPDPAPAIAEMARVLRPGGRLVIAELGRCSLWAALRRIRGWLGNATWRAARFRTAAELAGLARGAGLVPSDARGAVFYPPLSSAARLLAPIDARLGRLTTFGATFVALSAQKPR